MTRLALAAVLLAACGGDDGGTTPDAAISIDGNANGVVDVTCPATVDAMVVTMNGSNTFMPMTSTISVNGIVKFVMSSDHSVVPNPIATMTDSGLQVGFSETKFLKFTQTGTFGFMCNPHGFVGTVTVN